MRTQKVFLTILMKHSFFFKINTRKKFTCMKNLHQTIKTLDYKEFLLTILSTSCTAYQSSRVTLLCKFVTPLDYKKVFLIILNISFIVFSINCHLKEIFRVEEEFSGEKILTRNKIFVAKEIFSPRKKHFHHERKILTVN